MKKYGIENFVFEVICECKIEELDKLEIQYIEKYNSYLKGYNCTAGGGGQHVRNKYFSEETKKKLREKALHMTEEHKRKNSLSKMGAKNPSAKKVICNGKVFSTLKECAFFYDIPTSTLNHWLKGVCRTPERFIKLGLKYYDC